MININGRRLEGVPDTVLLEPVLAEERGKVGLLQVMAMKKNIARHTILALFTLLLFMFLPAFASAGEAKKSYPGDIILGLRAGYSLIQGQYAGSFRGSYVVGCSLMYGNSGIVKYLAGEMDITYARYPMNKSRSSFLQSASVSIGPVAYYPFAPWLQGYIGASARVSYLHLHTDRNGRNVKSLKPGLMAKVGFFFPVRLGFRLRAGADYTLEYLSGKPLHGVNFTGGLSYNFNPEERAGGAVAGEPEDRIDWYLSRAGRALADGDTQEAKDLYARVLAIDRNNATARKKIEAIKKAESDLARAMKLAGAKRYFEALPLLEDAAQYLITARTEGENIRKLLAGEIAPLEKQGISLYESGDYRGCIAVMKRLLLLDPKNRTGLIYLPRAQKRQEAMEKLR